MRTTCILLLIFSSFSLAAQADPILDSLIIHRPKLAVQYIENSLKTERSIERKFSLHTAALETYFQMGKYRMAENSALAAIKLKPQLKDTLLLADFHRLYARLNSILLRAEDAVRHFDTAMAYFYAIEALDPYYLTEINLAEHHRHYQSYEACKRHLNVVEQAQKNGYLSTATKANLYHRLAAYYSETSEDHNKSVEYSKLSLRYSESIGHVQHMATSYNELGYIYLDKDDRCLNYLNKALDIWRAQGAYRDQANALCHIARYHIYQKNDAKKGDEVVNQALAITEAYPMPLVHYQLLNLKAVANANLGNYQVAYEYRHQGALLYEDILYRQYDDKLTELSQRYETDLAVSKLQASEQEKVLALKNAEEQRNNKNRILYGFIFSSISAGALYFFYRKSKQSERQVEERNQTIAQQNTALNKMLAQKETLLQEVHHRVKNNFQYTLALLEMQYQKTQNAEARKSLENAIRRMSSMALVHEKLYDQRESGEILIDEYFNELIQILHKSILDQSRPISIMRSVESLEMDFSKCISLGMILSELISNSVKYAFNESEDPTVHIGLRCDEQQCYFEYSDNGKGFGANHTQGLGMRIIDMFSRQIEADYSFEHRDGVHFELHFNVAN